MFVFFLSLVLAEGAEAPPALPPPSVEAVDPPGDPPKEAGPAPGPRLPPIPPAKPAVGPEGTDPSLLQAAGTFFASLQRGDVATASRLCAAPFRLEAEDLSTQGEVASRWRAILRDAPLSHRTLHGVEVLSAEEMVRRHGPPPTRLALDLREAWVAVADVDGKPLIAVFRKLSGQWKAVAYTD